MSRPRARDRAAAVAATITAAPTNQPATERRRISRLLSRLRGGRLFGRSGRPCHLLRLDRFRLELSRRADHLFEGRVERGGLTLVEAEGVDSRHDEGAQIRALEPALLQARDRGRNGLLEL